MVGVDKNAAYPPSFKVVKDEELVSEGCELRQIKYLNNIIEQDHRFTKRRIWYSQWLQTLKTAEATISGYESMHMIRKGQVKGIGRKDALSKKKVYRGSVWSSSLNGGGEKAEQTFSYGESFFCTRTVEKVVH